ncbi:hypothetical protein AB0I81_24105 [Nonomuraea sp. NPDC050404]|uniref:hypothetical protein n=1 Tax=Nonomuraea sp. NPDC050404 TaxID=3155783 RepID=UPI00340EF16F
MPGEGRASSGFCRAGPSSVEGGGQVEAVDHDFAAAMVADAGGDQPARGRLSPFAGVRPARDATA